MALTPQWLDELRARTTLSNVIMRTTKLQRAGNEWKACCPFHDEKSPSFTVSDQKGFYHCFGCGAHGDVIRWMTDQRGLGFMDAVKELAGEAGMEVPAPDPAAAKKAEERAGLHEVMQSAQDWFVQNLADADGRNARDYLRGRGFSADIVERFGFGYAPDVRQAMKGALSRFDDVLLVEGGLRIAVDDKEPYDRFRARLMLPIADARGRVIAFGGRILDDTVKAPKYLNSPDTPLFDKGRTLYNLHRAGPASRQTGRMVVVEGYMDVIALANAGIDDAVAPMGTALTERQIEMLWRMVECPILCFDGDAAGQRAAKRAIERVLPMLRPSHSLAIVTLPAGMDPDDLLKERGREAMDGLLAAPTGLLDAIWQMERDAQPLTSPEAKAGLKERLLAHVDTIEHSDIRALYKRELLERFSAFAFPPRARKRWEANDRTGFRARNRLPDLPTRMTAESVNRLSHHSAAGSRDILTRAVLAGLAKFPDQTGRHAEALSALAPNDACMMELIDDILDAQDDDVGHSLESDAAATISNVIDHGTPPDANQFAFLREGTDPGLARDHLAEAVALLVERPALETALNDATARFASEPEAAFAAQQTLLKRKLEFDRRMGQMASDRALRATADDYDLISAPPRADEQHTD